MPPPCRPAVRRLVVVEDHPIFRDGVVQCLDAEPDFNVVGVWTNGDIDVDALRALSPDLVLMDIELPVISGIEATRRIRSALPDVCVVMLTAHAEPDLLFAALQVGAAGYLLKHTPAAELVDTLRRIADGDPSSTPTSPRACCASSGLGRPLRPRRRYRRSRGAKRRCSSCSPRARRTDRSPGASP